MKPILLDVIACPKCGGQLKLQPVLAAAGMSQADNESHLICTACGADFLVQNGIPVFSDPPKGIVPSDKLVRGPDVGTPWRQANWRFLAEQIARLDPIALILDVGAGRGDFAEAFQGHPTLALDVYPYPEVDLVCDLTQLVPFRPESLDAIVLMNVMEHVYNTHALLAAFHKLLKPGGILLVAIPFMVKIHQAPVDYVRYTHYALNKFGEDHNLHVELLQGYYDPIFFLEEGLGNLRWSTIPALRRNKRYLARPILAGIQALSNLLGSLLGPGSSQAVQTVKSMAPTGYHVVYRKPA